MRKAKKILRNPFRPRTGAVRRRVFVDFIAKELGPLFYNAGIEEAIRTHLAWSERIQEEMDLKKVY
jgi:uncharacterized protein (DUF2164 family)